MDPLSITAGCIGIIGAIAKTSTTIRGFVRDVRDARGELGATARHLAELDMTINLIKDDHNQSAEDSDRHIPESITAQTTTVIKSCHDILAELDALIDKHNPRRHQTPLRWVLKGKDEVSALNRQLEAHTRTLTMALEISTLSDTAALGVVSGQIKDNTTQLRKDTEQILSEMHRLRSRFGLQQLDDPPSQGRIDIIERYLDSLTNYAETVVGSFDGDGHGSLPRTSVAMDSSDDEDNKSLRTADRGQGTGHVRTPSHQSSPTPTPSQEAEVELNSGGESHATAPDSRPSDPSRPHVLDSAKMRFRQSAARHFGETVRARFPSLLLRRRVPAMDAGPFLQVRRT
ncbi:hypothetical protein C8A01DRAFT_21382 [Parachaetomium inaequale]|uniref:Fungal N-terminal domain-containing protein n=1 Tax=Parachaetomium inaequale TaxID=2588326 RepID=A0AAN6P439_9PEZI|nr:hypothetical protein C8A01DRAFT_21382 [Parachaetomium inaequale]